MGTCILEFLNPSNSSLNLFYFYPPLHILTALRAPYNPCCLDHNYTTRVQYSSRKLSLSPFLYMANLCGVKMQPCPNIGSQAMIQVPRSALSLIPMVEEYLPRQEVRVLERWRNIHLFCFQASTISTPCRRQSHFSFIDLIRHLYKQHMTKPLWRHLHRAQPCALPLRFISSQENTCFEYLQAIYWH